MTVVDGNLWLVALALLVFGCLYAYRAVVYPFPVKYTWVSVVLGTSGTNIGISIALWIMTHDWRVVLVPWVAYALSGLPNILGLALKYSMLDKNAEKRAKGVNGELEETNIDGDQA